MWNKDSIKEFTVDSLADYINLIKSENLWGCYFRGEKEKYNSITSTLARYYCLNCVSDPISIFGRKLIEEYYREIGYEIEDAKKQDFLAFSQHHGIKTNLIDFTTSPLVALYFACKAENYSAGYVYAITSESTVDATALLKPFCAYDRAGFNFYNELKTPVYLDKYKDLIQRYLFQNYHLCSAEELLNLFVKKSEEIPSVYCKAYIEDYKKAKKMNWQLENNFLKEKEKELKMVLTRNGDMPVVTERYSQHYCIFLLLFLKDLDAQWLLHDSRPLNIISAFPPGPYFVYKTPIIFDRIKRQSGVFIYQGIVDFQSSIYVTEDNKRCYGFALQPIIPDISIRINNQEEIIQDLDLMGVNDKTIYGDYDTIAKYVNERTLKTYPLLRRRHLESPGN